MRDEIKPFITGVIIFTILCIIYAVTLNPAPMISQDLHNQPIGEIYGEKTVGQLFISPEDKLTRIDIKFATYERQNSNDVFFVLKEAQSEESIVEKIIPVREIQNNEYHRINFNSIEQSKGVAYTFTISSPDAEPGNAITIWHSSEDEYSPGYTLLNNSHFEGDLTFRTYHTYTPADLIMSFIHKCLRDRLFFLPYIFLIGALVLLLLGIQKRRV